MSKTYRVKYHVKDDCSIEVEAESAEDAEAIVMSGAFDEDESYEFLGSEISDVWEVEELG